MFKKRTVVVTGGAGFLGSHLCDRFICDGMKVIAVDNLITGSERNIAHLKRDKNFDFIKHDVSKEIRISGAVDYIFALCITGEPGGLSFVSDPDLEGRIIGHA